MAETDRGRLIDAHRDLVESGRASDGCIHLAITAESVDPRRVNNVEVWTDSDALEAWRARANAPPHWHRYRGPSDGPLRGC
jgi:quinol monooxygenase YgiN